MCVCAKRADRNGFIKDRFYTLPCVGFMKNQEKIADQKCVGVDSEKRVCYNNTDVFNKRYEV